MDNDIHKLVSDFLEEIEKSRKSEHRTSQQSHREMVIRTVQNTIMESAANALAKHAFIASLTDVIKHDKKGERNYEEIALTIANAAGRILEHMLPEE